MKKSYIAVLLLIAVLFMVAFNHLCDEADKETRIHSERGCAVEEKAVAVTRATTQATTTTTTAAPETVTVIATAYCSCEICCGEWALNRPLDENGEEIIYTASGARAYANHTIAVDPEVFPFGTVLVIGGIEYVAEDTGAVIVGNKIDIYFDNHDEAWNFGRQELTATIKD